MLPLYIESPGSSMSSEEGEVMLGINDPWIWGVYLLCILSTLLCVVYGAVKWNESAETEEAEISEEIEWEKSEEEMQKKELGL
jgi:hypothetical protein